MTGPRNAHLLTLADTVDVLDLAGRIIADPRATRVPLAGELALAHAVERFWAVCLEAELLMRALDMPIGTEAAAAARHHAIYTQLATVRQMMAALRVAPPAPVNDETNTAKQETYNGHD